VLVAAYLIWRSIALDGAADVAAPIVKEQAAIAAPAVATAPPAGGEVVLTATDNVWVKIYDADNKRLYENEMKAGDKFTVPANASKPMIVTGRPQMLKVTVGGIAIPPLGEADSTIADVEVSAAALLARSSPPNSPSSEPQSSVSGPGN